MRRAENEQLYVVFRHISLKGLKVDGVPAAVVYKLVFYQSPSVIFDGIQKRIVHRRVHYDSITRLCKHLHSEMKAGHDARRESYPLAADLQPVLFFLPLYEGIIV